MLAVARMTSRQDDDGYHNNENPAERPQKRVRPAGAPVVNTIPALESNVNLRHVLQRMASYLILLSMKCKVDQLELNLAEASFDVILAALVLRIGKELFTRGVFNQFSAQEESGVISCACGLLDRVRHQNDSVFAFQFL